MKVEKKDFIARFDFVVCLADLHLIPKLPGNYCFVSLDSDTIYSGSSIVLRRRAKEHTKGSTCKRLSNSIKFHGTENYLFCYSLCSEDDLLKIEQTHLDFGFSSGLRGYCNVAEKAGGGNLGPAVNAKISKAKTGTKYSAEGRSNISKALTGIKRSGESRANQSKAWTPEKRFAKSKKLKGTMTGISNPNVDLTIYTFKHKDGRNFTGNRYDFADRYGIRRGNLNCLICGASKTTWG